jgi:hypothetical protein
VDLPALGDGAELMAGASLYGVRADRVAAADATPARGRVVVTLRGDRPGAPEGDLMCDLYALAPVIDYLVGQTRSADPSRPPGFGGLVAVMSAGRPTCLRGRQHRPLDS